MNTSFHASNPNQIFSFEAINSFLIGTVWHIFRQDDLDIIRNNTLRDKYVKWLLPIVLDIDNNTMYNTPFLLIIYRRAVKRHLLFRKSNKDAVKKLFHKPEVLYAA